jgi:hypothetical protein
MDYRKFITKKMPKILRAIGISSSSNKRNPHENKMICPLKTWS